MPPTIDRSTFLVLVTSIAGCAAQDPPPAAPLDIPIASVATSTPSAGSAPLATPSAHSSAAAPSASSPSDEGPSAESYAASEEGGSSLPCGRSQHPFDAARVGCDDSKGKGAAAPSCAQMKAPDRSCAPFPFPKQECTSWRTTFKPRVADAAIECANRLGATDVCDACNVYFCASEALMNACPDPSAAADCRAIARTCPSANRSECISFLSGMTATGRAKMASCMRQSCDLGFYSCSESI